MKPSNSFYNSLSKDTCSLIYFQLPKYDRAVVLPLVCKGWHQFTSLGNDRRECLKELHQKITKDYKIIYLERDYNPEQRSQLFRIIFNNNLISELKNSDLGFSRLVSNSDTGPLYRNTEILASNIVEDKGCFFSNYFQIRFDSKKFKISLNKKEVKGDWRSSYTIKIFRRAFFLSKNHTYKDQICGLSFYSYVTAGFNTEKKTFSRKNPTYSWKKATLKEEPYFDDLTYIIRDALNFELKNHVKRLIEANVQKFSKIKTLNDIQPKLEFIYDENGLITEPDNKYTQDTKINKFTITVGESSNHKKPPYCTKKFQFLQWEAPNLASLDEEIYRWKFTQIIQSCILSKTMEKLSKKLGVLIKKSANFSKFTIGDAETKMRK